MFNPIDLHNQKDHLEESSISQVNTIVPPAEGNIIHPDKIKDPEDGHGCFVNCLIMLVVGLLIAVMVSGIFIALPNMWLQPLASAIIPEYKYSSFYKAPTVRDTQTATDATTGIPISHHELVLYSPFGRHTDSSFDETIDAITYDFPADTALTMQRGQPQNLDPTGTINLSLLSIRPQLFEVTFSDLRSCTGIEDCLTYFALIVTKKMIMDTQPSRESNHTITSGSWSKSVTLSATIYQMDTVFSKDGSSHTVTLFVIPNNSRESDPYTLPSLKDLLATYAASTDPNDVPISSDQDVYTITITAPDINQSSVDTIIESISISGGSE